MPPIARDIYMSHSMIIEFFLSHFFPSILFRRNHYLRATIAAHHYERNGEKLYSPTRPAVQRRSSAHFTFFGGFREQHRVPRRSHGLQCSGMCPPPRAHPICFSIRCEQNNISIFVSICSLCLGPTERRGVHSVGFRGVGSCVRPAKAQQIHGVW